MANRHKKKELHYEVPFNILKYNKLLFQYTRFSIAIHGNFSQSKRRYLFMALSQLEYINW
ncbi:hypothetical protein [Flavobacterium psychrolimnae]|uniref:hypothetical protein n=1 Tax=Flavobacterium psychrolimnae TaxID=249351 RepID=UPI0011BE798D|nr:hypothetical protein [Flavobacterium psychrolimnae]